MELHVEHRISRQQRNGPLGGALFLASLNLPVLALHGLVRGQCTCGRGDCRSAGKHPATSHGVRDATADQEVIRARWRARPGANVGLATGRASGLAVIDIDPRNGGESSLQELERVHGLFPRTVEVLTGGRGLHFYFACGDQVPAPSSSGRLGPGIDVKGDGGYVVAPPSLHASGESYRWRQGCGLGELVPATLPDCVVQLAECRQREGSANGGIRSEGFIPLGRRALDFVWNGAPMGEQRTRALSAARNHLSAGYSVEETAHAIWTGLQASRWDPDWPWTWEDALSIASDLAQRAPTGHFDLSAPGPPKGHVNLEVTF